MESIDYSALFGRVRFTTALPESLAGRVARLSDDLSSLRNVHPLKSKTRTRFVVKYFIAGIQHTFGIFDQSNLGTAVRLADMLIVKFQPYRQRKAKYKVLTEDDLNLTPAQARADIENEPEINSLLVQFFCDLDEAALKPKPRVSRHRTARQEFYAVKDEIISTLTKRLDELEREQLLVFRRLENAVARIESETSSPDITYRTIFPVPVESAPAPAPAPIFICQNTGCPADDKPDTFVA